MKSAANKKKKKYFNLSIKRNKISWKRNSLRSFEKDLHFLTESGNKKHLLS